MQLRRNHRFNWYLNHKTTIFCLLYNNYSNPIRKSHRKKPWSVNKGTTWNDTTFKSEIQFCASKGNNMFYLHFTTQDPVTRVNIKDTQITAKRPDTWFTRNSSLFKHFIPPSSPEPPPAETPGQDPNERPVNMRPHRQRRLPQNLKDYEL